MFDPRDNVIYDELWDVIPAIDVVKGEAAVINDTFGFYLNNALAGNEVAFIYKMRQVLADKAVGTGEDIQSGERVYYIVANDNVSATPAGTPGIDSYYCGTAKRTAAANETTVMIRFDGTRYDETL